MTNLKFTTRGGVISAISARATILVLITGMLLSSCTGLKSSSATVSQGSAGEALVKPGSAQSAVLADLHGTVEVNTGNGEWTLANSGQSLKSGQQIRTGFMSSGTLVFYDGSQLNLGAEAEITLDALDARTSGARIIQLTQVSGESQHNVALSDDPGSHYDVNTSSGSGSATGTKFKVMVFPDQFSQFRVDAGTVSVTNENVTVVVEEGQTTSVLVGEPPVEPEFRITGEGQVMQLGKVDGYAVNLPAPPQNAQKDQNGKITLCHATGSATNPYVEITVSVAGATNGHAKHLGDIIPAPADGCPLLTPISSSTPPNWNIAGLTFLPGASLVVFGNPQVGDWVKFEGRQLGDGIRYVDRIELLSPSSENQFTFIGKVEFVGDKAWTISGREVQVNEFTEIESGLKVGDNVQVTGGIAEDGSFLAERISRTEAAGSNFRFAGTLTDIGNDIWVISGIKVTVGPDTTLYGDFVVGSPVAVEGMIQDDGTRLATTINLVTPEGYHFEFIGEVQSISPWTVSDVSFDIANWTEIDPDIKVGDMVRVSGTVGADGIWVAESIELLDTNHATGFAFFGQVLNINPWNVGGVPLTVDERTTIQNGIVIGEMVKVTGWIQEDGTWLATDIKHTSLHLGLGCSDIYSVVQSITVDQIILTNGQTIVRSEDLVVKGDLREASTVVYQYCVDEQGQGKVTSITVVNQLEELPQAKAVVCHIPPGNPNNQHTIEIGQSAVAAHLAHGDTLGPCPFEKLDKKPKKNN